MNGCGNDFVIILSRMLDIKNHLTQLIKLSDRRLGIGFDQLLIVEPEQEQVFYYHIINADGSFAKQCLNGARCVAYLLYHLQLTQNKKFFLENPSGIIPVNLLENGRVELTLKMPTFVDNKLVDVGNRHCISFVDDCDVVNLDAQATWAQTHYSEELNVSVAAIQNKEHIKLRTYERGVGETLACASAALATVFLGIHEKNLSPSVHVQCKAGTLLISKEDTCFKLIGDTAFVFEGLIIKKEA